MKKREREKKREKEKRGTEKERTQKLSLRSPFKRATQLLIRTHSTHTFAVLYKFVFSLSNSHAFELIAESLGATPMKTSCKH